MNNWKWKYFTPDEVLSPTGLKFLRKNNLKIQGFALDILEDFRGYYNRPIVVNSDNLHFRGWRSSSENYKVGGVDDSPHTQGIAFDCTSNNGLFDLFFTCICWSWEKSKQKEKNTERGFRGFGFYKNGNFCHFDARTIIDDVFVLWNGERRETTILTKEDFALGQVGLSKIIKKRLLIDDH